MLALVLGIVLFLSIAGIAILGLVDTTSRATASYSETDDALREIDSALETATQAWRSSRDIVDAGTCAGETVTRGTLTVQCEDTPSVAWANGVRTMDLTVERAGGGSLIGHARVRVVDVVNNVDVVGFSLEVCDWLLGRTDVAQPMKGCST